MFRKLVKPHLPQHLSKRLPLRRKGPLGVETPQVTIHRIPELQDCTTAVPARGCVGEGSGTALLPRPGHRPSIPLSRHRKGCEEMKRGQRQGLNRTGQGERGVPQRSSTERGCGTIFSLALLRPSHSQALRDPGGDGAVRVTRKGYLRGWSCWRMKKASPSGWGRSSLSCSTQRFCEDGGQQEPRVHPSSSFPLPTLKEILFFFIGMK